MAQFADIQITRGGLDMIAKSQAGDKLIFTGIKVGDGQIGEQSIPDMTDLVSSKKDVPINSVTAKSDGHAEIIGIIDNEDIDVGFFVREIGIYAKINDGGTPALYGYANAGNLASYISDKSVPMDSIKFKIDIVVGNASNVSFTSDKSIVYVTQENLEAHNDAEDSHPDIRQKITKDIDAHNSDASAHSEFDFVKALSAASDGLHYQMRSGESEQVLDLINQLQTTLSQGTVPSSNTGTLFSLLSGIIHQIAALSGKTNWYDAPKNNFETLSAGIVAGDVSDPNSWWVKLGGTIPLIIQGGFYNTANNSVRTVTYPLAFSIILGVWLTEYSYRADSDWGEVTEIPTTTQMKYYQNGRSTGSWWYAIGI